MSSSDKPARVVSKVSVQCPHCGATQQEPAMARSTYCRSCTQHFDIGVPLPSSVAPPKPAEDTGPNLWDRISGVFRDQSPREVACFECGARQMFSRSATSASCKECGAYIDLEDFKISAAFSRTVHTAGNVLVTARGDLSSIELICGSASIQGMMRGHLICTGEVEVKLKGRIPGAIETRTLRVLKKAQVDFVRPVKVRDVFIEGEASAHILAHGSVHITKTGRLTGSIYALGFTVEKGGVFVGDLSIGPQEAGQSDLLPAAKNRRAARAVEERQPELGFGSK